MRPLLERETEIAAVDALLAAARAGSGRALVVSGEPGIGKSALLALAVSRAQGGGFTVLTAGGAALETGFPFGVARQLLEAHAPRDGPAAAALGRAAPPRDAPGASALQFELRHGLYSLTASLPEPVLVAVDDLHWADADSLAFLVYLARRVDELHIALIATVREGEGDELVAALRAVADELTPAPLSEAAAAALLAADTALCRACHDASGGNPFLLHALAGELTAGRLRTEADVRASGPTAVRRSMLERLSRHGPDAAALARAAAVLGRDATLADTAAVAGVQDAAPAADALVVARVLDRADPARFAHPLLAGAVYAVIGPAHRAELHLRAARQLGARAPDRAAAHLLATFPRGDQWTVATLREAARRAPSADRAAALLTRALGEPPDERAEVLFELADAERRAGRPGEAIVCLREALEHAREPGLRTRIVRELVYLMMVRGDGDAAGGLLARAIEEDPRSRSELEADRIAYAQLSAPASERAQRLVAAAPDADPASAAGRRVLASLAFQRLIWGRTTGAEVGRMAADALAGGRLIAEAGPAHPSVLVALSALQVAERDREAAMHIEAALPSATVTEQAALLTLRGRLALFRGDLRGAEADLRAALRIADAGELEATGNFALATLVLTLVERGELEAAGAALAAGIPSDGTRWLMLQARAALRRAEQAFAAALEDVVAADELRTSSAGAALLGRSMVALTLHALGRAGEARTLAAEAVAQAERWGVPSTLGIALRINGVVTAVPETLERAAKVLEPTPRRLEYAHALVALGATLRRANRRVDARKPLAEGLDLAHRSGATVLQDRAMHELRLAGARPRRLARTGTDALTPSELRVAQLAAAGRTNREIGQALFVSRKTVETHLGAIYRKVGGGREDLAGKLQDPSPDARTTRPREALGP